MRRPETWTLPFIAGHKEGWGDAKALRVLRVFAGQGEEFRDWIDGYKVGFSDGCKSGAYTDPDRIRNGVRSEIPNGVTA